MKLKTGMILTVALMSQLSAKTVSANQENVKGLLPEVRLNSTNEDTNNEKAFQSEMMITKAENKAIESLNKIIVKKKGTPEESDLLFRLAELYMRRAKSGRFFDLNSKEKAPNVSQKAKESLKSAITIYNRIEKEFPKYKELDAVLFNNAIANQQVAQIERSKELYNKLVNTFPKSALLADALLEIGEVYYQQQNFAQALEKFKGIERFPKSKAYPYGIYKSAWCYYNLKQTDEGVKQLLAVIKQNPANSADPKKYNLRKEALRDLTLFVGETMPPEQLYGFFEKITTTEELGDSLMSLSSIYESHSRFKEINIFVKEFIEKHPENPNTAKCYAKLIDTNETLKQRDTVLSFMKKMAEFCANKPNVECHDDFRKISLEISKKWWEIWLKNKKNTEFSKLTEQAFEILLANEDVLKSEAKSRYAYAELLFQQYKFDQASKNYEDVSNQKGVDKTLGHDALYGALFSIEKSLDKKDDSSLVEHQKALAERYLKEYPNGEHVTSLQYKLGFIAYKQQDYDNALKLLNPLTAKVKYPEIKTKSEDLILDIYNIKKDNKSIQAFAKNVLKSSSSESRKQNLTKIVEQSHYAQIQTDAASLPITQQIDQLHAFSNEHANSKLGQDAFWQSISLAYSKGYDVLGADLSLEYAKKYSNDPRKIDSMKEATKAYIDAGQIKKSIATLRELAVLDPKHGLANLETSCDLLRVNNQLPEARGCYKGLFDQVDKSKKAELLSKMVKSFKDGKNSSELESLENQILKENIEPYATQLLLTKAKNLFNERKTSEAFNLSLKINSRPVDADIRAEARLIQAQVLEKEFVNQSVKAKESKFATVLAMKTEKLDKAHTAFSTTIKMSKNDQIQAQALQGIDRLYTHYIEAVTNMPIPDSLNPEEQKTLRQELVKLTTPFANKKTDNLAQLRKISKLSTTVSESINWAELNVEKTVEPRVVFPSAQKLTSFIPTQFEISNNGYTRLPASEKKCDVNAPTAASLGGCIQTRRFNEAETLAFKLSGNKETRATGLYYLSVIADKQGDTDKALWLIEKSYALDPENSMINYQKGKALYSVEGINSALPYFEKVLDMKKASPELVVMSALKSFSDKDYITATEEFSRLSNDELYTYSLGVLYVEATVQKGETDQALKLSSKFLNSKGDNVDMWIEQARVQELFAMNKESAAASYQKALSKTSNADQKDWLKKKIDFLKNKNSQITSYVGGN
ncbi:MAG: tetratricopeptide repeat protein [Bdellovibrio sp.]|nr:tetratricopeptide repeat protein [Bdellovibrio sp.]